LYSSPSIIRMTKSRRMRWAGHVVRIGEKRNAHRILVGKSEGKRRMCVDNTKIVLRCGMDWIDLAEDRDRWRTHVNTVMNHRILYSVGKFLSS
jgi:hypothetical protein